MARLVDLMGTHQGETVFVVGPGPSLLGLSADERKALGDRTTIAMSTFYLWPDAWEPHYYLSPADATLPEWNARIVEDRWPRLAGHVAGWVPDPIPQDWGDRWQAWLDGAEETGMLLAPLGAFRPGHGIACWGIHTARLLGASRIILLGLEHTPTGYVDNLKRRNLHSLVAERQAIGELAAYLGKHLSIKTLDASGPTSTLPLPKVELAEALA